MVIATIALAVVIAKVSNRKVTNPLTLEQPKSKFVYPNSTKNKDKINLPTIDIEILLVNLPSVIGYKVPTGIPKRFTIKYKLKTGWKAVLMLIKFDIEVFTTKNCITKKRY